MPQGGTKQTLCVWCGRRALRMNDAKQPVCTEHKEKQARELGCPECGFSMTIKEGRYGYFWGCEGYPGCQKTVSIKESLTNEKFAPDDVEIEL